jgi:predicted CoA-binding protein
MSKKTVIIGASPNPSRYAFAAAELLTEHGHEIIPVGIKKGTVKGKEILDIRKSPVIAEVDTVTLYVGSNNQGNLEAYILMLKPKRVIFNPGTENPGLVKNLEHAGISSIEACTLVMLRTGQY